MSLPKRKMDINHFDPDFYESQAIIYMAAQLKTQLETNVIIKRDNNPLAEIDATFRKNGDIHLIEIKSYPLNKYEVKSIAKKYNKLSEYKLLIVAPDFIELNFTNKNIQLITFKPCLENILERQIAAIEQTNYIELIYREIETGLHNFRFRLGVRNANRMYCFLNQVSKRINSIPKIVNELKRIDLPIIKIYWSKKQYLNPKDLFFKERNTYPIPHRGFSVLDIDGNLIHNPFFNCTIDFTSDFLCPACQYFANQHKERIISVLADLNIVSYVNFKSGKKGIHFYIWDNFQYNDLLDILKRRKIKIDTSVLTNANGVVGFPGSINFNSNIKVGYDLF